MYYKCAVSTGGKAIVTTRLLRLSALGRRTFFCFAKRKYQRKGDFGRNRSARPKQLYRCYPSALLNNMALFCARWVATIGLIAGLDSSRLFAFATAGMTSLIGLHQFILRTRKLRRHYGLGCSVSIGLSFWSFWVVFSTALELLV